MFSGIEDFERAIGYESPITQIIGQLETQMEDDCIKVVQQCGFDVNKEELTKALVYDRGQYNKGYKEGYTKAIDDFTEKIQWEYLNSCGIKQQEIDLLITVSGQVAEQLKEGSADNEV